MPDMTIADALRLEINVLRDAAESRKIPRGIEYDEATVTLHADGKIQHPGKDHPRYR
ncbi:hypothetical protein [Burkholderia mayonis]|uniref:hypothetical protein n=1 Tax=Burkholderia mayonis TaxID=1385591 RepID=UPI000B28E990|nr:hypothetical protein [Burkholderia mayonis]